jgi:hypothetical protein
MTMESTVAVFFALLGLALWMVPTAIAFSRRHPKRRSILLVDIFLSWTIIGWIFAMGWALGIFEDARTAEESPEVKTKASAAGS